MINLNHYYYFHLVAKYGGVTKAANYLNISQPSLSSQIKNFERSIGKKLFRKSGRKLELTSDGVVAYTISKKIFDLVGEFENYVKDENDLSISNAHIGVAREVERPFIADVLTKIFRNHKKKRVSLSMPTGEHAVLLEQLLRGELDVLVTNTASYVEGVKTIASIMIPVIPVASPSFFERMKLAQGCPLKTVLKSKDVSLVLPSSRLKLRIETDLFLQKYKIVDPAVFESDILSAVVRACIEGAGVAFLPKIYVEKELKAEALWVLETKAPCWSHKIFLVAPEKERHKSIVLDIEKYFKSYKS